MSPEVNYPPNFTHADIERFTVPINSSYEQTSQEAFYGLLFQAIETELILGSYDNAGSAIRSQLRYAQTLHAIGYKERAEEHFQKAYEQIQQNMAALPETYDPNKEFEHDLTPTEALRAKAEYLGHLSVALLNTEITEVGYARADEAQEVLDEALSAPNGDIDYTAIDEISGREKRETELRFVMIEQFMDVGRYNAASKLLHDATITIANADRILSILARFNERYQAGMAPFKNPRPAMEQTIHQAYAEHLDILERAAQDPTTMPAHTLRRLTRLLDVTLENNLYLSINDLGRFAKAIILRGDDDAKVKVDDLCQLGILYVKAGMQVEADLTLGEAIRIDREAVHGGEIVDSYSDNRLTIAKAYVEYGDFTIAEALVAETDYPTQLQVRMAQIQKIAQTGNKEDLVKELRKYEHVAEKYVASLYDARQVKPVVNILELAYYYSQAGMPQDRDRMIMLAYRVGQVGDMPLSQQNTDEQLGKLASEYILEKRFADALWVACESNDSVLIASVLTSVITGVHEVYQDLSGEPHNDEAIVQQINKLMLNQGCSFDQG